MKLLLLCMNYAPESTGIAPFTTGLSEELVRRGHTVAVATTFPHYPHWETQPAYRGKWFMTENLNGVTVRRTRVYLPRRAGAVERVLYDSSLSVGNLIAGTLTREVDLILAVEPPIQAGVMARALSLTRRVPYMVWVHDLALEAAMSVGMLQPSAATRLGARLEAWAHAGAQKIFVLSRGMFDNLEHKGTSSAHLVLQPDWVEAEMLAPLPGANGFRHTHDLPDQAMLVVHSGNMGVKQQLENVLAAAERLRARREICFVLVGDGSQKKSLMETARRTELANVRFLPLQPREALPQMMAAADILLVNQHPDIVDAVIPSKLLTYIAAARPVVIAAHTQSEAAREVRDGGYGVVVAPNDPEALAQAIAKLADDPAQRARLGQRGRVYAEQNFERTRLLDAFERELCSNGTK